MHRVFGKVLVQETSDGIPNLVVGLFDRDVAPAPAPAPALVEVAAPTPTSAPPAPTTPPPATAPPPAVGTFTPPVPGQIGQRIGSVLTGPDGGFELSFESDLFAAGDPEQRPDLVLAVFAPEDSQSADDPTPLPPERRILLLSNVPRQDAGRTEAYVLRIRRAQLDRFGIPYGSGQPSAERTSERLVDSVERAWEARRAARERLAPRLREEADRVRDRAARATAVFARLAATPTARREGPLFVRRGERPQEAQTRAIELGIQRFGEQHDQAQGGMPLRLTEGDLTKLGVAAVDGRVDAEVAAGTVMDIVGRRGFGQELARDRSIADVCRDQHALDRALAPGNDQPPIEVPQIPLAPPNGNGAPAEAQIVDRVLGQIHDLETAGTEPIDARADATRVQAELDALQLKGGPADVSALHDFTVLQLAFKHVWTEAFDESIREQAEQLYGAAVQLSEEMGIELPDVTAVTEINELRDFLAQMRGLADTATHLSPVPSDIATLLPEVTTAAWNMLGTEDQWNVFLHAVGISTNADDAAAVAEHHRAVAEILTHQDGTLGRMERLILGLSERLSEPYAFDIFAPDSYNFGILGTYRQRWQPLSYQVGDLVATIPLAPGESRKFSQRLTVKKSRSQREVDKSLSSSRDESTQTTRADAEIVEKATTATNFRLSARGAFKVGIVNLAGTTDFARDQQTESARVKRDFREAVVRAAQEYSRERTIEISTTASEDLETTTSGELSNPNNELTVTYLLYELQRRFQVDEQLHRLTPVILVAQDVPAPHEIDEAWLLAHDWILRRVLLDDSLAPALTYLRKGLAGDETGLEIRRAEWELRKNEAQKEQDTLDTQTSSRDALRETLADLIKTKGHEEAEESSTAEDVVGAIATGGMSLLFGGDGDDAAHTEAEQKGTELLLEFAEATVKDAAAKAKEARAALRSATDALTAAVERQAARRTAIDRLRVHVKDNILYYMQAIWSHEPPDQRFFRLYDNDIAWVPEPLGNLRLVGQVPVGPGEFQYLFVGDGIVLYLPIPAIPVGTRKLVEVADLDRLLGYKGNYMIFPLKESCYLTTYMMREFVDAYLGLRDPDDFGTYSTEELLAYAECLYGSEGVPEEQRDAVRDALVARLSSPRRDSEEIVVPTGKLFIEALPGAHPLLEDFKLRHRAMDVRKVRAEVRGAELENLRRAARLIAGEREDPDIDKRVLVQGAGVVVEPN